MSLLRSQSMSVFVTVIILMLFQQTCFAKHNPICPPSSCGKIRNISYPFRLKSDAFGCGLKRYELDCVNNVTVLTLFSGKYHVQDINYKRYEIQLTDAGVVEETSCSIPHYFLSQRNFTDLHSRYSLDPLTLFPYKKTPGYVIFLNCSNPVNDDPRYVKANGDGCDSRDHIYAILSGYHDDHAFKLMDIKVGCKFFVATFANWTVDRNVSYGHIQKWLHHGFGLSWLFPVICKDQCGRDECYIKNQTTQPIQLRCGPIASSFLGYRQQYWRIVEHFTHPTKGIRHIIQKITGYLGHVTGFFHENFDGQLILLFVFLVRTTSGFCLYSWIFATQLLLVRLYHSMNENIENFLLDNNLKPIRYEHRDIKIMTGGFKVKLGQGGFGSVYKGKRRRSGSDVAIKMLSKSKANGEEFTSEVATIGRIHHVNVVRLVGYCVDRNTRALIYEYMPNGSLDKYISPKEGIVPLSYQKTYEISLGIARGIAYLHQGCDVQILHFDIKPHNILLDENFIPKISDFGLAKLHVAKDRSLVLPEAIGTLGYIAPELFYKNIGGVSYKADVYSFGKLLIEMASRRRNSDPLPELSSNNYFPIWIYDEFKEEKDIVIEDATEEDKILVRKMFIVAFWCIQLKPNDRPSMKRVVEMLEGNVESLEMPPRPALYPCETVVPDGISSNESSWSDSTSSNSNVDKTKSNPSLENNA